ncbi:hypothetical protein ACWCQS_33585 [Streptomyces sp. NPDC002076]
MPGSDLDSGLGRLRRHALTLAHDPLDSLCDRLSARMPPGSTDDIALFALHLPEAEAEAEATSTGLTSPEPAPEPGTGPHARPADKPA